MAGTSDTTATSSNAPADDKKRSVIAFTKTKAYQNKSKYAQALKRRQDARQSKES